MLYSENIDMSDSTILGIEKVTADCSDEVLFAVSFDDGASWWSCINAVWAKLSEEKIRNVEGCSRSHQCGFLGGESNYWTAKIIDLSSAAQTALSDPL